MKFPAVAPIIILLLVYLGHAAATQERQMMRQIVHPGSELDRTRISAVYYALGKRMPGDRLLDRDKYFNYDLGDRQNFTFSFVNSLKTLKGRQVSFIRVAVLQDSLSGSAFVKKKDSGLCVEVRAENTHFCAASVQFYGQ